MYRYRLHDEDGDDLGELPASWLGAWRQRDLKQRGVGGPTPTEPVGLTLGVIALVFAAGGIAAGVASYVVFWSSWESAILLLLLSWFCTGVGLFAGAGCWLVAHQRRRRDWSAVAATLLGLATVGSWVLYLFLP